MKKEKAKSESKKAKKELENKLIKAFTTVIADYGKTKKTKSIIEKFSTQLSKKVEFKSKKEVEIVATEPVVIELAKPKVVKNKPVKKVAEIKK